jgi:predicted HAD superfamily Cof-like phosphohydrolase
MLSDFEKVLQFNKSFGVKMNNTPQKNLLVEDPKMIEYRLSLVTEEYEELVEAIKQNDFTECIDALADITYVVMGFYAVLGVNADEAFDIVHKSNMSKLCVSEEEAKETVEYYMKNKEKLGYYTPAYRRADDGVNYVVYNESTKKILKSINYTPANFEALMNQS